MESVTIIIPSRIGSTRLPRKPLLDFNGKPMVYRIYEKCLNWGRANDVFVATDSEEIKEAVESRGGKVIMTSPDHENGTSRCIEAFEKIGSPEGILINIQGDEPFVSEVHLNGLVETLVLKEKSDVSTILYWLTEESEVESESVVKAKIGEDGIVEDFFRKGLSPFGHIGIYGFRTNIIHHIKNLPSTERERNERLEQLKWMEGGIKIGVEIVEDKTIAIDVLEDYQRALEIIKSE